MIFSNADELLWHSRWRASACIHRLHDNSAPGKEKSLWPSLIPVPVLHDCLGDFIPIVTNITILCHLAVFKLEIAKEFT